MPRSAKTTRGRIFAAAYRLLFREGFSRTSMDAIAAAAGVTKKTLYYHFDSKDALVEALLTHQQVHALDLFRGFVAPQVDNPVSFVRSLFGKLEEWVSQTPWYGSGFTRLTMELADMPGHPARSAAHRHKAGIEIWLADELRRLGQVHPEKTARQFALLIEGCLALVLVHQDPSYVRAASEAAERLLLADAG